MRDSPRFEPGAPLYQSTKNRPETFRRAQLAAIGSRSGKEENMKRILIILATPLFVTLGRTETDRRRWWEARLAPLVSLHSGEFDPALAHL